MTLNHWVEGSSPSGRTFFVTRFAVVAELADAQDLGSCTARCGGSSPSGRTCTCVQVLHRGGSKLTACGGLGKRGLKGAPQALMTDVISAGRVAYRSPRSLRTKEPSPSGRTEPQRFGTMSRGAEEAPLRQSHVHLLHKTAKTKKHGSFWGRTRGLGFH